MRSRNTPHYTLYKREENIAMADNSRGISFQEMVEIRKDEMESILPGFYTIVTGPKGQTAKIYSKSISNPLHSNPSIKSAKSNKKKNH